MSLFTSLSIGASGLGVSSTNLAVVGDNISNINTIGYKGSRATFIDFLPQRVQGIKGKLGTGAATDGIQTLFGQGTLEASSNPLDMAITGNGFFMVREQGSIPYYTRNGGFYLSSDGYILNNKGMRLQGYQATNGDLGATLGDIQVQTQTLSATATTEISVNSVLSAEVEPADTLSSVNFSDGATSAPYVTLEDAANQADFTTSISIYDSLGVRHDVTVLMERTDTATWKWYAIGDASEVDLGGTAAGGEGEAFLYSSGTMEFDGDGNLTTNTSTDTTGWTFTGASAQALSFNFGRDASGAELDGGSTRMNGIESSVTSIAQDGRATGTLTDLAVSSDGTIRGSYTNGESLIMGQVLVANFDGLHGLERVGNTLFRANAEAGAPAIGVAGTGGRGGITGSALEKSNVNLEEQFVTMITAQRTYQANARVVSAANEALQTLVQLV